MTEGEAWAAIGESLNRLGATRFEFRKYPKKMLLRATCVCPGLRWSLCSPWGGQDDRAPKLILVWLREMEKIDRKWQATRKI